jgi:hypothetical protein
MSEAAGQRQLRRDELTAIILDLSSPGMVANQLEAVFERLID